MTGIYACLTYGIMRQTRRSVDAMQQQTEALARPYVSVAVMTVPGNHMLFLRITNIGRTTAERLRLEIDRPFYREGDADEARNLATYAAFTGEITSFAPGAELIYLLGVSSSLFDGEADETRTPMVFKVTATYRYSTRTVTEVTEVDLRPYGKMHVSYDPLVEELSAIRDVLRTKG